MTETAVFSSLLLPEIPEPRTMFEFLVSIVRRFKDNIAFVYTAGEVEHRVTYLKLFEDVAILARAFRKQGVASGDKVMIFSDNRYAWIVTDFALSSLGAVSVPRGTDTTAPELEYIIEHAECSYLVVEHGADLDRHAVLIRELKQLKTIFVMEAPPIHKLFSNIYSYNDLLSDRRYTGKDIEQFLLTGNSLQNEDLLTIIYTSGTTGQPKGVPLSHRNILHNISVLPELIQLTEQDSWLSILPSWHIFERTAEYVALAGGTTIVYSSIRGFAQDLEKYRPTLVATVPRVWESLYSKVQAALAKKGRFSQRLFGFMIWVSTSYKRNKRLALGRMPVFTREPWIVRLAKRKVAILKTLALLPAYKLAQYKLGMVRQRFGGRLRLAISGGGSLAGYLEEWIDAVGIRIVNAYGMTECSPAIAGRGLTCRTFGTLGPPVPRTEVRIVNEQGQELPPGVEGEVEVRGEQVTNGYYRNVDETVKSFTADGYFRTGDLGKMTIKGELVLTGRVKEIIVLSSGENIDPTRIENAISVFPFIQDAVLVGQDKKGLGALLVPDIEELKHYVSTRMSGLIKDTDDLLTNVKVLDHVRNELNRILKPQRGFKHYEKLQNITFLDKEFKLGEELTNTLKKKRHVIEKKYRELINQLLH